MFNDIFNRISTHAKIITQKRKIDALSQQQKVLLYSALAGSVVLNVMLVRKLINSNCTDNRVLEPVAVKFID